MQGKKYTNFILPSLFKSTDRYSTKWQHRFLIAQQIQLMAFIGAAIGGATSWVIVKDFQLSALITIISLICAISAKLYLIANTPEKKWYNGRAAAESIKTLAWKYAQGASPFEKSKNINVVDQLFLSRVQDVLSTVAALDEPATINNKQITKTMKAVRSKHFEYRKRYYMSLRINDQMDWYRGKASSYGRKSNVWGVIMLAIEAVALLLAILRFAHIVDADLSGVFVAIVASGAAWIQSKQYESLSQSYSVTSQELSSVSSSLESTNERDWPSVVEQAEDAISREHTLWKASHK